MSIKDIDTIQFGLITVLFLVQSINVLFVWQLLKTKDKGVSDEKDNSNNDNRDN